MARKVIDIIYNLVRKRLAQSGAYDRGPGITSLPDPKAVESGMQQVFKQLKDGGLNPVSADKIIKSEDDLLRVIEEINQKKIKDTEARQKAAQGIERVFYKMKNNIPLNADDQAALQGSGFKTPLDNFKGFEPKVIQGGKSVPVKFPKNVKKDMLESYDNLFLKGEDTKYDADVLATDLAERRGFIKEGQDSTDMDQKKYSDLYSEAYSFLTELRFLNRPPRKPKKAAGGLIKAMAKLKKKFGKDIIQKGKAPKDRGGRKKLRKMFKDFEERTKKEGGGLAYMLGEPRQAKSAGGVISKFLKALSAKSPAQRYKDYLASVKKRSIEGDFKSLAPELGAISAGGILVNRKMKKILEEGNELQKERFLKEYIEELNNDPSYDDRPELKDKLIEKYTESLFGEKRADGGRIGFADGGMSRRTFLKIMAALASFPIAGKLFKTAKVAKKTTPIVTPTSEMPAHFPKLVEKIIREGQVVDSEFIKKTGNVKKYRHPERSDIELEIEGDGDVIRLEFNTDQGMKGGYEFRKGEIIDDIDSPMRGKRAPNEFDQGEVKYRMSRDGESYTKDFEEGIETGTENLDEFAGVGKQKTSKSKTVLPDAYDDLGVEDFADGGLAGLLGE